VILRLPISTITLFPSLLVLWHHICLVFLLPNQLLFKFLLAFYCTGVTLWHLQKYLQYSLIKFLPSIILQTSCFFKDFFDGSSLLFYSKQWNILGLCSWSFSSLFFLSLYPLVTSSVLTISVLITPKYFLHYWLPDMPTWCLNSVSEPTYWKQLSFFANLPLCSCSVDPASVRDHNHHLLKTKMEPLCLFPPLPCLLYQSLRKSYPFYFQSRRLLFIPTFKDYSEFFYFSLILLPS
jgi:hypothetical protein